MHFSRLTAAAVLAAGLGFISPAAHDEHEGLSALEVLETIEVAPDDACTEYDRSDYHLNRGWGNQVGGYRDMRDYILARDAEDYSRRADGAVEVAVFTDPYTGRISGVVRSGSWA